MTWDSDFGKLLLKWTQDEGVLGVDVVGVFIGPRSLDRSDLRVELGVTNVCETLMM